MYKVWKKSMQPFFSINFTQPSIRNWTRKIFIFFQNPLSTNIFWFFSLFNYVINQPPKVEFLLRNLKLNHFRFFSEFMRVFFFRTTFKRVLTRELSVIKVWRHFEHLNFLKNNGGRGGMYLYNPKVGYPAMT